MGNLINTLLSQFTTLDLYLGYFNVSTTLDLITIIEWLYDLSRGLNWSHLKVTIHLEPLKSDKINNIVVIFMKGKQ